MQRLSHTALFAALLMLVLLGATGLFWPALTGPFIFDDHPNLENLRFLGGETSLEAIGRYLAALPGPPHRPLAMLSFVIEDFTWPAYPLDFKRDNLMFHLIAGLLVVWFARELLREIDHPEQRADWIALAVGAAWLVSPIQLSSTMLVVQRMNILSSIFVLAGLIGYVRILRGGEDFGWLRAVAAYAVAGVFGVLAYLCKENGALIVLYLAVLNFTLLAGRIGRASAVGKRVILYASVLPLVLAVLFTVLRSDSLLTGYAYREFSLGERLMTQPRILFEYLGQIALPRLSGQGIFHDNYPFSVGLLSPPTTLLSILAWLALAVAALVLKRREPLFSFAILWFLAGHAIESSFIGLELYFEHRNYLPMFGLMFVAGCAVGRMWSRHVVKFAALSWLAVNVGLTHINAQTWGSRGQQAQVWLAEHPDSPRATQWAASYFLDIGEFDRAQAVFVDAIARMPHRTELQLQQIYLRCLVQGLTPHDKTELYRLSEEMDYSLLGPAILRQMIGRIEGGRCHDTLERRDVLMMAAALMRNPKFARDGATLASIHYQLSRMYSWQSEFPAVRRHLERSYLFEPNPLVARELAVYALGNQQPQLALRYAELSNATPMPRMKRYLLDVAAQNRGIEAAARKAAREAR